MHLIEIVFPIPCTHCILARILASNSELKTNLSRVMGNACHTVVGVNQCYSPKYPEKKKKTDKYRTPTLIYVNGRSTPAAVEAEASSKLKSLNVSQFSSTWLQVALIKSKSMATRCPTFPDSDTGSGSGSCTGCFCVFAAWDSPLSDGSCRWVSSWQHGLLVGEFQFQFCPSTLPLTPPPAAVSIAWSSSALQSYSYSSYSNSSSISDCSE